MVCQSCMHSCSIWWVMYLTRGLQTHQSWFRQAFGVIKLPVLVHLIHYTQSSDYMFPVYKQLACSDLHTAFSHIGVMPLRTAGHHSL